MKTADPEIIASAICGAILMLIGIIGTVIGVMSIFSPLREFLEVSECRVDFIICGPMIILLSKALLGDIFKRDRIGKKGIR